MSREGIWERLAAVPDHRSRRGRIYPLSCLAAVWLCALTAAGHDRVAAVTEWLRDTTSVDSKSNETTAFRPLLERLDLTGKILTFDAMHTVRANLDWLVTEKNAHYFTVIKGSQPMLKDVLAALPWADVPTGDTTRDHGHGRDETRTLEVATVAGLDFPHATQAIR
ncbi:transposase family protein, partial [Frankia sp. CcWB2]